MGYENLKLEKGMYRQEGMNFTQVLESLDPSENYRGTALESTDAFQRQLKRFGIRVKGAGSSTVEKFFRTMDSAVLFPEYIARTVRQGMEENDILPAITATTTVIDSMDYRSIYSNPADEDKVPASYYHTLNDKMLSVQNDLWAQLKIESTQSTWIPVTAWTIAGVLIAYLAVETVRKKIRESKY